MRKLILSAMATLSALLLAACVEEIDATTLCFGPEAPAEASCRWVTTDHPLIMQIEGIPDQGSIVYVEYENKDAGAFRTKPVNVESGRFEILVPRLRGETTYSFQVHELTSDGEVIEGRSGRFTTGELPEALRQAEIKVDGGRPTTGLVFMDFNIEPDEEEEAEPTEEPAAEATGQATTGPAADFTPQATVQATPGESAVPTAQGTPGATAGTTPQATVATTAEPTPQETADATSEPSPEPTDEPQEPAGPTFYGLIAIDGDGEIVWYVETDYSMAMTQKPNHNIVLIEQEKGIKEITPLGEMVDFAESPCKPDSLWHHEMHIMPDGRLMTVGYTDRDVFNDPSRPQAGDTIVIWDQDGGREPEEVWNVFDHIDATTDRTEASDATSGFMWRGCNADLPTEDWTHANSATVAPDGNILFSMRHLNQVIAISPDFEEIVWRLGGPGSDFTFPEIADRFFHQHAAFQLENGNVLLFDNGNTRPEEEGGEYSRALELELNFDDMTASTAWEYRPDDDLYARAVSNAIRLDNGNTHVHFGTDAEEILTIVEADEDGDEVWQAKISAPGLSYIYRSYPGQSVWGEHPVE